MLLLLSLSFLIISHCLFCLQLSIFFSLLPICFCSLPSFQRLSKISPPFQFQSQSPSSKHHKPPTPYLSQWAATFTEIPKTVKPRKPYLIFTPLIQLISALNVFSDLFVFVLVWSDRRWKIVRVRHKVSQGVFSDFGTRAHTTMFSSPGRK